MNPEENDELWQLLGRARSREASPFFARNVLREVRQLEQERSRPWSTWRQWLFRWPALATAACLAVVSAGGFFLHQRQQDEQRQLLAMAERVYASPDYGVINSLDELLDSEKNSAWLASDAL